MTDWAKLTPTLNELQTRREAIEHLAAHHGARNVRVFDSVARGEARVDSDIDFLVAFEDGTSIWDVIGLWQDLSDLLGCEVSVVDESTLEGRFRENVLKDAVPISNTAEGD